MSRKMPAAKKATKARKSPKAETASKPATDSVTVLLSRDGTASKRFYRDESGEIRKDNFNAGMFFHAHAVPVSSLIDLSECLLQIEKIPKALVIRGDPLPHVDVSGYTRRLLVNFQTPEVGRRWVLIDFDKIDMPEGMDLKRDTLAAMEHLVHLLPVEFHDCSYHYQLSSSAGMGDPRKISAHVWFWLTEPWTDQALKDWAGAIKEQLGYELIDPALFNDVQPHFTAVPVFDGVEDPFPVRSALVEKANQAVSIKAIAMPDKVAEAGSTGPFESGPGFEGWLELIGDHPGGMGFRQPILRATACYVAINGREGTDVEALYQAVRKRVLEADRSAHTTAEIEERASREHIMPGIVGALEKFGDEKALHRKSRLQKGVTPHHAAPAELTVAGAQEALRRALKQAIEGAK